MSAKLIPDELPLHFTYEKPAAEGMVFICKRSQSNAVIVVHFQNINYVTYIIYVHTFLKMILAFLKGI